MDNRYSGDKSQWFWNRVNSLDHDSHAWHTVYSLGCALQNLEGFVLRQLLNAEQEATLATKKRKKTKGNP